MNLINKYKYFVTTFMTWLTSLGINLSSKWHETFYKDFEAISGLQFGQEALRKGAMLIQRTSRISQPLIFPYLPQLKIIRNENNQKARSWS